VPKFALCWILAGFLSGCVNNPAYVALDSPQRSGAASAQSNRAAVSGPAASQSTAAQRPASTATRPGHYRVQSGDTLYSIAFRYGLDFRKLAHANNIGGDYTIFPGQQLALREADPPRPSSTPASSSSNATPTAETRAAADAPGPATATTAAPSVTQNNNTEGNAPVPAPATPAAASLEWGWPHDGKIVRTFNANVSDQKGVDLTGQIGDSVKAAANGTVVYAGNGLPGYGNLIIVEHPGALLSAYAFNQELLVSERETVSKGQVIARMGSQGDQPRLPFEIRQEGKPVDPMRYLPRR
jgi:lipoprotein NlpD